jgi:hypothetical protein
LGRNLESITITTFRGRLLAYFDQNINFDFLARYNYEAYY